jgi:hypothetical protein
VRRDIHLAEINVDPLTGATALEAGAVDDNPADGRGRGGKEVTAAVRRPSAGAMAGRRGLAWR